MLSPPSDIDGQIDASERDFGRIGGGTAQHILSLFLDPHATPSWGALRKITTVALPPSLNRCDERSFLWRVTNGSPLLARQLAGMGKR